MVDAVFRLIRELDSFKRVALFLLTGMAVLSLYFGYRSVQHYDTWIQWNRSPKIIYADIPCNLVQIRDDVFLVSITLPKTKILPTEATRYTTSLWISEQVDRANFRQYCQALVESVASDKAEEFIRPFLNRNDRLSPN